MQCNICELRCNIDEGKSGKCNMYINKNNKTVEQFPNSYLFTFPISIETQPMLHFYPRHKFLQVSSVGCNFKCKGCISEMLTRETHILSKTLKRLEPHQIIEKAKQENCLGITFGINDPIVSYHTFKNLAKLAKKNELLIGFSSNLYFTEEALLSLIPYVDFVNVGVKGFSDNIYKNICKVPSSFPVFRNIKFLKASDIHFEVSIPYIKGEENEVLNVAKFLSSLSKNIPLQLMRFIPLGEAELELEPTIKASETLIEKLKKYLNYVYLFNSPGTSYLDTSTKDIKIQREFYGPMGAHVVKCDQAEKTEKIIVGSIGKTDFDESGFFGGYRITRAIEMIIAILNALDIYDNKTITNVLLKILKGKEFMESFHIKLDTLESSLYDYLNAIKQLGVITNRQKESECICSYIEDKLNLITNKRENIKNRLKSYYVMGYPLFALNGGRFENKLAEFVGLCNVNKNIEREGKPGINITSDELNALNPDIVFISGFLSCPENDFLSYASEHHIDVNAIRNKKVYCLPPSWDFGSLNWILGLMFIASKAYPEYYRFDIEKETSNFYRLIYKKKKYVSFNRSFKMESSYGIKSTVT